MTLIVSFFTHTLAMIDHALSAALHSFQSRHNITERTAEFVDLLISRGNGGLQIGDLSVVLDDSFVQLLV